MSEQIPPTGYRPGQQWPVPPQQKQKPQKPVYMPPPPLPQPFLIGRPVRATVKVAALLLSAFALILVLYGGGPFFVLASLLLFAGLIVMLFI